MFNKLIKWFFGESPITYIPSAGLKDIIKELGQPVSKPNKAVQDYFWFIKLSNLEYSSLHDAPSFLFLGYNPSGDIAYIELRPEVAYACIGRN